MKFDYKIFLFLMFLWAMLIIMTGWMTQPMFHAINGVGFLFIIFYLYLTMKNMVFLEKMTYKRCVEEEMCEAEE